MCFDLEPSIRQSPKLSWDQSLQDAVSPFRQSLNPPQDVSATTTQSPALTLATLEPALGALISTRIFMAVCQVFQLDLTILKWGARLRVYKNFSGTERPSRETSKFDNSKRQRSGFWAYARAYQAIVRCPSDNRPNPQDGRDARMLKGTCCRYALV